MTKADIVDMIYEKVGFSKKELAKIVDAVFDMIKETLQRGDKLVVSRFGTFGIRNKKARRGRNPQGISRRESKEWNENFGYQYFRNIKASWII